MNVFSKFLTGAVAALTLSTGVLTTTPSSAYYFHHWGCCHAGWGHHWGYGWRHWGYHGFGYSSAVVVTPVVVAPASCPPGTHLGSLGKHCWPNR